MKSEQSAHRFMNGIKIMGDEKTDHHNCEFKQWVGLFTQKLDKQDDCCEFIKKYILSISALKEAKSTAASDEVLLRLIICRD